MFGVEIAHAADLVTTIKTEIATPIIQLLFAFALIFFIWGVVNFQLNKNDPQKAADGKKHMIWGIVGLVVMSGAFGIINIITGILTTIF